MEQPAGEDLRQLHDALTKLLMEFYEWRHKIMTRFAVVMGALILTMRWLIEGRKPLYLKLVVLGFGAAFCVVMTLLDTINQSIIHICYERGKEAEKRMGVSSFGMFQGLDVRFRGRGSRLWLSYRVLLRLLYLLCGALCIGIAVALIARE